MEVASSFEKSLTAHQSREVVSQKIRIFLKTAVKTSKLDIQLDWPHRQRHGVLKFCKSICRTIARFSSGYFRLL